METPPTYSIFPYSKVYNSICRCYLRPSSPRTCVPICGPVLIPPRLVKRVSCWAIRNELPHKSLLPKKFSPSTRQFLVLRMVSDISSYQRLVCLIFWRRPTVGTFDILIRTNLGARASCLASIWSCLLSGRRLTIWIRSPPSDIHMSYCTLYRTKIIFCCIFTKTIFLLLKISFCRCHVHCARCSVTGCLIRSRALLT